MQYVDFHIHPSHSIDACLDASLEKCCQVALNKGIESICFTTHIDFNPKLPKKLKVIRFKERQSVTNLESITRYAKECQKLKDKYYNERLKINVGLEIDYSMEYEQQIMEDIPWSMIDYSLLGVHYFKDFSIASLNIDKLNFLNVSLACFFQEYFKTLENAIRLNIFDAVAHIDQYKKTFLDSFDEESLLVEKKMLSKIFFLMKENNLALEINTSKRTDGKTEEWTPNKKTLELASNIGIKNITVGSDSHKLDNIGLETREALQFGERIGMELLKLPISRDNNGKRL